MVYQGDRLTVSELIAAARKTPTSQEPTAVTHRAADAAAAAAALIAAGELVQAAWVHGILQTIDFYRAAARSGSGPEIFVSEPPLTGSAPIDAAFAALAEYLSERDGWPAPDWVDDATRFLNDEWLPNSSPPLREEALTDSVPAFARHGIRVSYRALSRA